MKRKLIVRSIVLAFSIFSSYLLLTRPPAALKQLAYPKDFIELSGTGSMYPTFPKGASDRIEEQVKETVASVPMERYPQGFTLFGRTFFSYTIGRGDIVSLSNQQALQIIQKEDSSSTGLVKRVIALPGDTFEIRDGLVYLNNRPLLEPYTARARSTFGGKALPECRKITVPEGRLVVMGDNRKSSNDSRHDLGFIAYNDIDHVISWSRQHGWLDKNWRSTKKDLEESSKITLDIDNYLKRLNERRSKENIRPLTYQPKLAISAARRGEVILKYNDFSFEATRSGYTMERALRDAGYSNVIWGEAPTQGYYEAEELIENQLAFAKSKAFLLNPEFQEIGIGIVTGKINNCPTQVIVQHFGGYKPANYESSVIESWKQTLKRLREIQPGWEGLKQQPSFYEQHRTDVDRLIEIIALRIHSIAAITDKMERSQWLSEADRAYIEQDQGLYEEQERLATQLNNQR